MPELGVAVIVSMPPPIVRVITLVIGEYNIEEAEIVTRNPETVSGGPPAVTVSVTSSNTNGGQFSEEMVTRPEAEGVM